MKTHRNTVTRFLLFMLLALFFAGTAKANDISIVPTGAVYRVSGQGLVWGQSGGGGINNNFFFTPVSLNEYVCVYIYNNNPTSAHNFNFSLATTGNPNDVTPSDGTWQTVASTASFNSNVKASPSLPNVFGGYISGVSQAAIEFLGSSTQPGSPDTANVILIQSQGACPVISGVQTNGYQGVVSVPPSLAATDSTGRAYVTAGSATNPGAANPFLIVTLSSPANNSNFNVYWNKAVVSCTAACIITVAAVPANATCSATSILLQVNGSLVAPTEITAGGACSTSPAQQPFMSLNLTANTPYTVDLTGFVSQASTTSGIALYANSFTGTVNGTLFWWER